MAEEAMPADAFPVGESTIEQQLLVPGFAAYWGHKYVRIVNYQLQGKRIGDLSIDFGLPRKKAAELVAVVNAFAAVGIHDADFTPGERPDFTVKRDYGRTLAVEHSDIMAPCPPDAAPHVQRQVAERVRDDATLRHALGAHNIAITIDHAATATTPIEAMTDACPGDHVGNHDARKLTDEIITLIRSRAFLGYIGDEQSSLLITATPATPTLTKYRASISVRGIDVQAHPLVTVWSQQWVPRRPSLFQAACEGLSKKQADAAKYDAWPDWLVLNVVERAEDFMDDLGENPVPNIAGFRRVFILLWRRWQLRLTVWTPRGRYQGLFP